MKWPIYGKRSHLVHGTNKDIKREIRGNYRNHAVI
jgi:hypothetical protein